MAGCRACTCIYDRDAKPPAAVALDPRELRRQRVKFASACPRGGAQQRKARRTQQDVAPSHHS
jgi:hypothetical protein